MPSPPPAAAAAVVAVRAAIAPMLAEPRAASVQVSQALAGHRLQVLERREAWLRVRGADAYEGWVHEGYVRPVAREAAVTRQERISLGCVVHGPMGRRALPLGAVLDADEQIDSGRAAPRHKLPDLFPPDAAAVVRSAAALFEGTPYEWGGVTPWGADCSGFVQSLLALHGIAVPRDAGDQASRGTSVAIIEDAGPADLLFFSEHTSGEITHVGLAIGGGRMAHVGIGRGGYAVEDFASAPDPYVVLLRRRFQYAKRVVERPSVAVEAGVERSLSAR
jgi:hypothetical protein